MNTKINKKDYNELIERNMELSGRVIQLEYEIKELRSSLYSYKRHLKDAREYLRAQNNS